MFMRKLIRKIIPKKIRKLLKRILGLEKKKKINTKKQINKKQTKKKKIDIFTNTPRLTIKQICMLAEIEIPEKYKKYKNTLLNYKIIKEIKQINGFKVEEEYNDNFDKNIILLKNKTLEYQETLEFQLKKFVEKYYTQAPLEKNGEDLLVYIIDWLYHYGARGFTYNDYFDYEIYNKTEEETDKFLNGGYRNLVKRLCNNKKDGIFLKNKGKFNTIYAKYVKREWLDVNACTYEQFKEFIEKYPTHFCKPIEGTGGTGAGQATVLETDNIENVFKEYKNKKLIIEEIVKQNKELAKYNESSLNTIRVYTLLCADGKARVLAGIIRMGRKGNTVDNFHCGGITAVLDVEKGIVETEAINRVHERFTHHPDTNLPIKGFKIPYWENIVKATTDAAKIKPTLRHIGWDVAVTENGDVELIEGNSWPNFDAVQTPDQKGRKYCYEKYINELKQLKKSKMDK